jgi:serine/threonine protein phosphatase PrpC
LSFPSDPEQAIKKGFENAEKNFINSIKPKNLLSEYEHSGSCANVVIIIGKIFIYIYLHKDDNVFVANVGDSRAIYSENRSNTINMLSKDHKPNDPDEKKRIVNAGGYIYQ